MVPASSVGRGIVSPSAVCVLKFKPNPATIDSAATGPEVKLAAETVATTPVIATADVCAERHPALTRVIGPVVAPAGTVVVS